MDIDSSYYIFDFSDNIKYTAQEAIEKLKWCRKIAKDKRFYNSKIKVYDDIQLLIPGKYDNKYPGDYLMTIQNTAPKHKDVCDSLIRSLDLSDNESHHANYKEWTVLLEDVYENGTLNIDKYSEQWKKRAVMIMFWVSLQEDIHHKDKGGRRIPFCRYAEAMATTQEGFDHVYEEVIKRINTSDGEMLEKWDLPIIPNFYCWSAW